MQSIKETASNVAASAVSGMEKTKANVQEKVEKLTAHTPVEKEMATEKKAERVHQAELHKQEAREQNAAAKMMAKNGGSHSFNQATGDHKASSISKHNVGQQPTEQVLEGAVKFHPITGTGKNTRLGDDGANTGYGSA